MKQATAAKLEEEARKKALLAELDQLEQQLQGSKDEEQVRKSRSGATAPLRAPSEKRYRNHCCLKHPKTSV